MDFLDIDLETRIGVFWNRAIVFASLGLWFVGIVFYHRFLFIIAGSLQRPDVSTHLMAYWGQLALGLVVIFITGGMGSILRRDPTEAVCLAMFGFAGLILWRMAAGHFLSAARSLRFSALLHAMRCEYSDENRDD